VQGATWAIALAVVGAGWYFTNYVYIQHSTVLTEIKHIDATARLSFPQGIEYMDGKVYITDYQGASVGVYDLAAGTYSPLQIKFEGADVPLGQPGDIKAGPNGDLYLLNNGPAENALLVIKPDGTVVRKIALDIKTPVASGLQIRPDGTIYVSDVSGGSVWKYGPNGGSPLAQYRGQRDGFDNILGLLVRPDGKIYAAESTTKLVQELDADGNYLRSFSIGCSPFYMSSTGDWLDVTCPDSGIFSVNLKTGNIQRTTYSPDSATAPRAPIGITYSPDGKLYVGDGSRLIVYEVQH
jgi:outer membrane protein assembly factor BamB